MLASKKRKTLKKRTREHTVLKNLTTYINSIQHVYYNTHYYQCRKIVKNSFPSWGISCFWLKFVFVKFPMYDSG